MALLNKHRPKRMTSYPKIGTVSLGIKAQNTAGKEYPKSTGYFVIKTENQFWQQVILQCYGDKPNTLYITLPSKELSDCVHHVYQLKKNGELIAETDDQTLWRFGEGGFKQSDPAEIRSFGGI